MAKCCVHCSIYRSAMLSTSSLCAETTQQAQLLVLGPTMRHIQWVPVLLPQNKAAGHSPPPRTNLRMSGAIVLPPYAFMACDVTDYLYLYHHVFQSCDAGHNVKLSCENVWLLVWRVASSCGQCVPPRHRLGSSAAPQIKWYWRAAG
jgi:hypothetical protein